jgi:hypothetical protein
MMTLNDYLRHRRAYEIALWALFVALSWTFAAGNGVQISVGLAAPDSGARGLDLVVGHVYRGRHRVCHFVGC